MPILQPVDERFLTTAPFRVSRTWSIARPANDVWEELCRDGTLDWCRGLRTRWTSDRPFAVGTTREAKVLGLLTVQERYFIWEEGRRQAFFITEANLPIFRSLAEDYVVEPDGPDRCTFTWSAAAAPAALGRPGTPVNKLLFKSFFRDTSRHFNSL
jgi:hypothetical protein